MDPNKRRKSAAKKPAKGKKKSDPKADAAAKTKRATQGTKPVQRTEPAPEETGRKLPGKRAIQILSKDFMAASDRASTLAGKAGELISDAVKKIHLNAREFKRAHGYKSLGLRDPSKLRLALDDFDYYRECLDLDKLAGDSLFEAGAGRPELPDEEETEAETAEADEDAEAEAAQADAEPDNIHRLGRGREAA